MQQEVEVVDHSWQQLLELEVRVVLVEQEDRVHLLEVMAQQTLVQVLVAVLVMAPQQEVMVQTELS
jgi:AAA+ superfamily predicted ATPase